MARTAKAPWAPGMARTDDGLVRDFTGRSSITSGMAVKGLGEAQVDSRRRQWREEIDAQEAADPRFAASADAMMLSRRPAGDPAGMDAFFGLMQAKANAAEASGKKFSWDPEDIGTEKVLDVPTGRTYNIDAGEVAPGMRGRPPADYAKAMGFDPGQRGFYTPDEMGDARQGLAREMDKRRFRR